jgi:hypothetical protein
MKREQHPESRDELSQRGIRPASIVITAEQHVKDR